MFYHIHELYKMCYILSFFKYNIFCISFLFILVVQCTLFSLTTEQTPWSPQDVDESSEINRVSEPFKFNLSILNTFIRSVHVC